MDAEHNMGQHDGEAMESDNDNLYNADEEEQKSGSEEQDGEDLEENVNA
jgi:hypothetical protein